jgi:hypothetical protein
MRSFHRGLLIWPVPESMPASILMHGAGLEAVSQSCSAEHQMKELTPSLGTAPVVPIMLT